MHKTDSILKNWLHPETNLPALLQSEWAQTFDLILSPQVDSGMCTRFWASHDISITSSLGARSPRYYLSLSTSWRQGLPVSGLLVSPWLLTHSFPSLWRVVSKMKTAKTQMSNDFPGCVSVYKFPIKLINQ